MQRPRASIVPVDLSQYEEDDEVELVLDGDTSDSADRSASSPLKRFTATRSRKGVVFWALLLGVLVLVVCTILAVEMRLLPSTIIFPHCSPQVLDASNIDYYADDRFSTMIKTIKPFAPPVFTGNHRKLCKDSSRLKQKFHYCLPISGTKDSDFCSKADRLDLLLPQTRSTRCHASVLHMLLVDVYEELQAHEYSPILTYGSLLGAVRNGSIIPFTEDTDIAYSGEITSDSALAEALWKKGYHLFTNRIWRVCVAPTHPLAGNLFDPDRPAKNFAMPYVDLYSMNKTEDEAAYTMQELRRRTLPTDSVEPFSKVMINGLPFNTVHDPEFFLAEYGADFRSPKPRNRGK